MFVTVWPTTRFRWLAIVALTACVVGHVLAAMGSRGGRERDVPLHEYRDRRYYSHSPYHNGLTDGDFKRLPCADSIYCSQDLLEGIWLGPTRAASSDVASEAGRFTFSGCAAIAYMTIRRYNQYAESDAEHSYLPVTEIICECRLITYREKNAEVGVRPAQIVATTYSNCLAAALLTAVPCDCNLPTKPLPHVGLYSGYGPWTSGDANPYNFSVQSLSDLRKVRVTIDGSVNGEEWVPGQPDNAESSRQPLTTNPPSVNVVKVQAIKPRASGTANDTARPKCRPVRKGGSSAAFWISVVLVGVLVFLGWLLYMWTNGYLANFIDDLHYNVQAKMTRGYRF